MIAQPTPRKSITKQAALARRLNAASRQPAPHVIRETIYDETIKQPVLRKKATESFQVGGCYVAINEHYYLVASKFLGYYYLVSEQGYICSSSHEEVAAHCIAAAIKHKMYLRGMIRAQLAQQNALRDGDKRVAAQALLDQLNAAEHDLDVASAAKDWKAYDDAYWSQQANVKQLAEMGCPPMMTSKGWNI